MIITWKESDRAKAFIRRRRLASGVSSTVHFSGSPVQSGEIQGPRPLVKERRPG